MTTHTYRIGSLASQGYQGYQVWNEYNHMMAPHAFDTIKEAAKWVLFEIAAGRLPDGQIIHPAARTS